MLITPHFSLDEFACKDGTSYPAEWITDRLALLCETLEVIRREAGDKPLRILSGYRTPAWNQRVEGSPRSQHVEGRAADIQHPSLTAAQLHSIILLCHGGKKLAALGGLGLYESFVHVDVRQNSDGRLRRWSGKRVGAR
jgi:uncharacterized protein YcbK (DUF882 family)